MSETTETHYCFYHPSTPTELRCNKCGKYICVKDARAHAGGLSLQRVACKEQQDIFFTATPAGLRDCRRDHLPIAFIAARHRAALGFLAIFAGPIVGIVIAEGDPAGHAANGADAICGSWHSLCLIAATAAAAAGRRCICAEWRLYSSRRYGRRHRCSAWASMAVYLVLAGGTSSRALRFVKIDDHVCSELTITDFAIIDRLHLQLAPGFNVLTGETGAGKSIIIDAVSLLLGGKADSDARARRLRSRAGRRRVRSARCRPNCAPC